jgi:hypothetical protein
MVGHGACCHSFAMATSLTKPWRPPQLEQPLIRWPWICHRLALLDLLPASPTRFAGHGSAATGSGWVMESVTQDPTGSGKGCGGVGGGACCEGEGPTGGMAEASRG